VDDAELQLELDGRVVETVRVRVEPQTSASAVFQPVTLHPAGIRAVVRVAADALAADNSFHFVLTESRPVPVLLAGSGPRGADDTYLRRALAIGQSPRFEVTTATADTLSDDALGGARVVIVNDAPLGDAAVARLTAFAERGGGVLVVAGGRAAWPQGGTMPGTLGAPVDRSRGAVGRLSGVEYGHAVFAPFRAPRSGDFSSVLVYGYRRLVPAPDARVLARYDDGQPALVERSVGTGRMLVWTSGFDLAWNDVALKPVFLPFVHQMVRTLGAFADRPASLTVGQVAALERRADGSAVRVAIEPSGRRVPLDPARGDALELSSPGFYEVRGAGADPAPEMVVAANVDLSESDLTSFDPATVAAAVSGTGSADAAAASGLEPPRDEVAEQSQRLWWYVLFAGMLLLIGETLLASRMSRGAA
jgi:hypothetical protein